MNSLKKESVNWNSDGLIPVVVQEHSTKEVLMHAWMNHEALQRTVETGWATYWSRSRKSLWKKGETSGDLQKVKALFVDCDKDTLLLLVEQQGKGSCHTGEKSCFYERLGNT